MKVIQSAGGPLIGLAVEHLELWSGSSGKSLTNGDSRFRTDYEAATYFAHGRHAPPRAVALMNEKTPLGLLISTPLETSIFSEDCGVTCIAQVDYADPGWNFESISMKDFNNATFLPSDEVRFSSEACKIILFDAAYAGRDVGDDFLAFNLSVGDYVLSAAEYQPNERTGLILYMIQKIEI